MPSSPSLQAWRNTTSPGSAMCSLSWRPIWQTNAAACLARVCGSRLARAAGSSALGLRCFGPAVRVWAFTLDKYAHHLNRMEGPALGKRRQFHVRYDGGVIGHSRRLSV